jgi:hypothetical protein
METKKTEKLFVYGIFLNEYNRDMYGMSNPDYQTVKGYITVGGHIVQAVAVENQDVALTGLVVDMDSNRWGGLDSLEGGYDRIKIKTTNNIEAFMYARHREGVENFSTYKMVSFARR